MAKRKDVVEPTWYEGDLVVLKSGGPVMVVEKISMLGLTHVSWFNDYKDLQRAYFKPDMLVSAAERIVAAIKAAL